VEWGITMTIESTEVTFGHQDQLAKERGIYEFNGITHSEGTSVLDGCSKIDSFVKLEIKRATWTNIPEQALPSHCAIVRFSFVFAVCTVTKS
jgi:hypothetical protein